MEDKVVAQKTAKEQFPAVMLHTLNKSRNLQQVQQKFDEGDIGAALTLLTAYIDTAIDFVQDEYLPDALSLPMARAMTTHYIVRATLCATLLVQHPEIRRQPLGKDIERSAFEDVQTMLQFPDEWFGETDRKQFNELKYAFHLD